MDGKERSHARWLLPTPVRMFGAAAKGSFSNPLDIHKVRQPSLLGGRGPAPFETQG